MIWDSIAKETMDNIFREAVEKSSRERKDDTTKRLSFYHDEQVSYIQQALTVHYVDVSQFTPTFFNVVKKITNQLSMVYLADAQRDVDGSGRDKAGLF